MTKFILGKQRNLYNIGLISIVEKKDIIVHYIMQCRNMALNILKSNKLNMQKKKYCQKEKNTGLDVRIDRSNYIEQKNALECTALLLSLDTLKKTRNVAISYRNAFRLEAGKSDIFAQKLMYMEVAIKCIDEIIAQKLKKEQES